MLSIKDLINERITVMEQDIKSRIHGVKIASKSFLPEGGKESIQYKQLIVQVVLNGNITDVPIKIDRNQALLLEAAAEPDTSPIIQPTTPNTLIQ